MSENKRTSLFLLLFACSNFWACSNHTTGVQNYSPRSFLPLAAGNYWIYNTEYWVGGQLENQYQSTLFVDTSIIRNDEQWFGYSSSDSIFYRADSSGLWRLRFDGQFNEFKEVILPYPSSAGDCWYLHSSPQDSHRQEIYTISATASIEIGMFDGCIKYGNDTLYGDGEVFYSYGWFKPGLGRVKGETRFTMFSGYYEDTKWELKDYHFVE